METNNTIPNENAYIQNQLTNALDQLTISSNQEQQQLHLHQNDQAQMNGPIDRPAQQQQLIRPNMINTNVNSAPLPQPVQFNTAGLGN